MMKFFETHYDDYISSNNKIKLHPKIMSIIEDKFPRKLNEMKNIILYGPDGVGKYTTSLQIIKKYSPTHLKYEKKMNLVFNKQEYCFKISDIHYEIDFSLLGCNSKVLWHEIYLQIVDIVSSKTDKSGIILCKNFNEIQIELLDNFYSYMQTNILFINIIIKFVLITESLGFIPDNIINTTNIVHFPRPSNSSYKKIISSNTKIKNTASTSTSLINTIELEKINNIKGLCCNLENPINHYESIVNTLIHEYIIKNRTNFLKIRELLYDIFVYNLEIHKFIWKLLNQITSECKISNSKFTEILIKTYLFFKYFNNNYRPIYHLELYIYNLILIVNKEYNNY